MKTQTVVTATNGAAPVQIPKASNDQCPPAVREFIVQNFLFGDDAALHDDTSFLNSGIVDSTGVLELIMFLQDSYRINIETEEVTPENLDSLNRIGRFLQVKLAETQR